MALESEYELNNDGTKSVYVIDSDKPEERHLAFLLNPGSKQIHFYPKDEFLVSVVELEGFKNIPPEISNLGYFKAGLSYYFNKKFQGKTVKTFRVVKERASTLRQYSSGLTFVLGYKALKTLKSRLTELSNENKLERSLAVDEFFHTEFPSKFEAPTIPARRRANRAIRNLDKSIIEHLVAADVEKFLDFMECLLEGKYSSAARRRKLFGVAKLKVDEVALKETIETYETKLKSNESEHKWGHFLQKHLYLIDSKYVSVIGQLNVVLGGERKVDFGLIDSQGYLDLFEIKKPTTQLLSSTTDRGNYYWSSDAVKAITQAEKYLYNAERKASSLAEDIAREKKIVVSVIRPRAVVIMGHSEQLNSPEKETDFRVLRMSLKNVEIVTYDELLQRMKNQMSKIYIE